MNNICIHICGTSCHEYYSKNIGFVNNVCICPQKIVFAKLCFRTTVLFNRTIEVLTRSTLQCTGVH